MRYVLDTSPTLLACTDAVLSMAILTNNVTLVGGWRIGANRLADGIDINASSP